MRSRILVLLLTLSAASCETKPRTARADDTHVTAAHLFTRLYARSRYASWNLQARAGGANCEVLVLDCALVLDETMIEAMHYGAGVYDVYAGGVQKFSREHAFRGVAYRDAAGRVWTFGAVTAQEEFAPCP